MRVTTAYDYDGLKDWNKKKVAQILTRNPLFDGIFRFVNHFELKKVGGIFCLYGKNPPWLDPLSTTLTCGEENPSNYSKTYSLINWFTQYEVYMVSNKVMAHRKRLKRLEIDPAEYAMGVMRYFDDKGGVAPKTKVTWEFRDQKVVPKSRVDWELTAKEYEEYGTVVIDACWDNPLWKLDEVLSKADGYRDCMSKVRNVLLWPKIERLFLALQVSEVVRLVKIRFGENIRRCDVGNPDIREYLKGIGISAATKRVLFYK